MIKMWNYEKFYILRCDRKYALSVAFCQLNFIRGFAVAA